MFFAKLLILTLVFNVFGRIQGEKEEEIENNYWPDISCHNSELMEELLETIKEKNELCLAQKTPSKWMKGLNFSLGNCPKICLLEELSFVEFNGNENNGSMNFRDDDGSMFLMELSSDYNSGLKYVKKVKADCGAIFERILYKEKHPCNSPKVDEIMNCAQNALKC